MDPIDIRLYIVLSENLDLVGDIDSILQILLNTLLVTEKRKL